MKEFLSNTRKVLLWQNILSAIIMFSIMVGVYILADGGSFDDIIEELRDFKLDITIIGILMTLSSVNITNMAFKQAKLDEEDNNDVISALRTDNADINNKLDEPKIIREFTDKFNEDKFKEEQAKANKQELRKLKNKLDKINKEDRIAKINSKINELEHKQKTKFNKFYIKFLKNKKKNINKATNIEKRIKRIENGKLNARVKRFKYILPKDFTSIQLEEIKGYDENKLKSTLKRNTLAKTFGKSTLVNFVFSFGIIIALNNIFKYDFADRWKALLTFSLVYVISMALKFLLDYLKLRRKYKLDTELILKNRNTKLKQCESYYEKHKESNTVSKTEVQTVNTVS